MAKAIGCISGGLDSSLAAALLKRMGVEIIALHAIHLWHPSPATSGEKPRAIRAAEMLGITLVTIDASQADLEMIQHPRHGLGKRMNPCIDCRIWVLRQARALMLAEQADFVFTGEVLGQRPMSQHRAAMDLIERESGLTDLLLRPLSAQWFLPTRPEREGLIDRRRLLAIRGRSRKTQLDLAKEFGITDYPSPAGGCLLTDPGFAYRLRELMAHKTPTATDIELLKVGRHFRLADGSLLVIGRNQEDNSRMDPLFRAGDVRLEAADVPGPTTLLRGSASTENLATAAALTLRYTKVPAHESARVIVAPVGGQPTLLSISPASDADAKRYMISPENGQ